MADHIPARHRSVLDAVAEDTERLQEAIRTRTVTATSADGRITVAVSADGTVHDWRITGADDHTTRLVASLLELIGQAQGTAQKSIRIELDAIDDREEVRAATDAVRDALAQAVPPTTSAQCDDTWDYDYESRGKSRIAAD
ncbi:YbaB/EbfC family DNA-binding protein [Nocardia yunnanensis]|uniref:YbaB/EbfC family DNA-binding protein n=1 Tax=Nocardia yunnanensis TaxID=2382165 RepID=A0A386ZM21_9NOCA|nr:YbaB/EbfC family nucleoid-associated protein [Nocardia yunnanensis]AYF78214.1 YbaB/EbfC family DNA-binding protein [Nocardia yunnanensis]